MKRNLPFKFAIQSQDQKKRVGGRKSIKTAQKQVKKQHSDSGNRLTLGGNRFPAPDFQKLAQKQREIDYPIWLIDFLHEISKKWAIFKFVSFWHQLHFFENILDH